MAKELKDIEYDLERATAHLMNDAIDDARHCKLPDTDIQVSLLKIFSRAVCTLAYVSGMSKEAFQEAMAITWEDTKASADEAAARIETYMNECKSAMKEAGLDIPDTEKEEPSLKN